MLHAPATKHVWRFFRTGGIYQVALQTAEDLLALRELDQKLWVALSCPTKGLELDPKTLELIDSDDDGHIHVRDVIAAVEWAAAHLKKPADLLAPEPTLPLAAINDLVPEGRIILQSARQILKTLGKPDAAAISVEDTADTAKILAARAPNGDGVITLRATNDAALQQLIRDIIATVGGVPDRAGGEGIDAAKVDAFFKDLEAYLKWLDATAAKNIPELGDSTAAACLAVRNVHAKVDDYFARCRLAEFDIRALTAVNRQESEYLAFAAKDLTIATSEIAGLPLARVEPAAPLPLLTGVNPAWADAMAALHRLVVTPLFGAGHTALTPDDWAKITAKFAPYEAWLGSKVASPVEKLGAARAKEIAHGPARTALAQLIEQDKALAPEYQATSAVAKLARFYRDLRTLLHNFVNFADFFSPDRRAIFEIGTLFLDSRGCYLCIQVEDVDAHATFGAKSMAYVAYLKCERAGCETMKIAACFTQGDSDYVFVGRHGLFYDRQGRDWDATIVKVIDAPISIRQAFWSPYRRVAAFVEEQFAKFAAAKDQAATTALGGAVTKIPTPATPPVPSAPAGAAAAPPKAPPVPATVSAQAFDIAKFAGIFAAVGLALGTIGGAITSVVTGFFHLKPWQMPLAVAGALLLVSGPSMLLAALKLRQRNVGPLLEANGWAINGRVKINIPFGTALTRRALLPANSRRIHQDVYEDKGAVWSLRIFTLVVILTVLGAGALVLRHRGVWTQLKQTWPALSGSK